MTSISVTMTSSALSKLVHNFRAIAFLELKIVLQLVNRLQKILKQKTQFR